MRLDLRDYFVCTFRLKRWFEIVRDTGAEQCDLPLTVPRVEEAGDHTGDFVALAKHEATQSAATEVPPPIDEPFGQLEGSQTGLGTNEARPLRQELSQANRIANQLETQNSGLELGSGMAVKNTKSFTIAVEGADVDIRLSKFEG